MATNGVHGVNGNSLSNIISGAEFAKQEYDYLILGGGTAGLAIAARLSEDSNVTVGVIEAGKNNLNDQLVDTPALFPQMFNNPEYDWKYMSTPQIGASGKREDIHHLVRGKMLGGSSGINYMMYVRGSTTDYDDWATILGDDEWSTENMKQYMRKHQTLDPIDDAVTDRSAMPFVGKYHGTHGPVHTSFNPWALDIEDDVIKAADNLTGYAKKPVDPWSGDHIGFYQTLAAISRSGPTKGKRSYAARGYFEANSDRQNLKATVESHIMKITLDGDRATGAVFKQAGHEYTVRAKREVIVCCGSIASPQVLELSGIGNPEIIEKAGLRCQIENKAIGENFQDHVAIVITHETKEGIDTLDSMARPEVLEKAMKAYQEDQTGPLSCTSCVQGFYPVSMCANKQEIDDMVASVENIKDQTEYSRRQREKVIDRIKDDHAAALQLVFVAATGNLTRETREDQSKLFPPLKDPNGRNGVSISSSMHYPVSRGSVHIQSSDPEQQPAIDPGYLTNDADVGQLAAATKFCAQLAEQEPLKSKLGPRIFPRAELDLTKTEDCRRAVMEYYLCNYHPVGSVAMGDALDSRLRVKGAKGLRVADASVFPGHVSGNIMSTVYMIGEKAADLIKEDWAQAA